VTALRLLSLQSSTAKRSLSRALNARARQYGTDGSRAWRGDMLPIFGLALGLRLVFSLLMSNTFDEDEFVYLALGRDVAHGAVAYRDFAFFHPPGILVLLGLLNPLTAIWWPLARLVDVVIDSFTAVLVACIAAQLYSRGPARAAGILYAVSPVVLVSAVRVDQAVIITALEVAGLALLLLYRSQKTAVMAGMCLGIACWIKYPMLMFLPVYLLAGRRRAPMCLLGWLAAIAVLFFPYLGDIHRLYSDTIVWQLFQRQHTPLGLRVATTAVFWLIVNPFAVGALIGVRKPLWLILGFVAGGAFLFASSTYSHYFVPIVPYAALLGAPLAARLIRVPAHVIVTGCLALTIAWATGIGALAARPYSVTSRFSDIRPVIRLIDRTTSPGTAVLSNRFEYAFLAGRPWVAHYFWDDYDMVSVHYLERGLSRKAVAVLYPSSAVSFYPRGLVPYLDSRYLRIQLRGTSLWLPPRLAAEAAGRQQTSRHTP